jgi:putative copper export protein
MLELIVSMSRTLIGFSAFVTLVAGAIFGGSFFSHGDINQMIAGAIMGIFLAMLAIAAWLGPVAALYLIAIDVRRLTQQQN